MTLFVPLKKLPSITYGGNLSSLLGSLLSVELSDFVSRFTSSSVRTKLVDGEQDIIFT